MRRTSTRNRARSDGAWRKLHSDELHNWYSSNTGGRDPGEGHVSRVGVKDETGSQHRLLTVETCVRSQDTPCGIYDEWSGSEVFLRVLLFFPVNIIPPLLFIHSYATWGVDNETLSGRSYIGTASHRHQRKGNGEGEKWVQNFAWKVWMGQADRKTYWAGVIRRIILKSIILISIVLPQNAIINSRSILLTLIAIKLCLAEQTSTWLRSYP
jgi:hypothetical protein